MPTYVYDCLDCFEQFEKYVPYTEDIPDTAVCPKCEGRGYRILLRTTPPVIYNTGGFYKKDNKKESNEN